MGIAVTVWVTGDCCLMALIMYSNLLSRPMAIWYMAMKTTINAAATAINEARKAMDEYGT